MNSKSKKQFLSDKITYKFNQLFFATFINDGSKLQKIMKQVKLNAKPTIWKIRKFRIVRDKGECDINSVVRFCRTTATPDGIK